MAEEVETCHEKDSINAKQPVPLEHFNCLLDKYLGFGPSFNRCAVGFSEVLSVAFLHLATPEDL
jgi:hypothetical protein